MPMPLKKGIHVSSKNVLLSSGTEFASCHSRLEKLYAADARIPRSPWREAKSAELELLSGDILNSNQVGTSLAVVELPDSLRDSIRTLDLGGVKNTDEFSFKVKSEEFLDIEADIVKYFMSIRVDGSKKLEVFDPILNPPGLPTSTFDHGRSCYLGLHLDSWDGENQNRDLSSNRVTVNLGRETRHFVFVNQTVAGISQMIGSPYNLDQFFVRYPDYPVIKIGVPPGNAYIAPTENIIHDGCTFDQRMPDVSLTLQSWFRTWDLL